MSVYKLGFKIMRDELITEGGMTENQKMVDFHILKRGGRYLL